MQHIQKKKNKLKNFPILTNFYNLSDENGVISIITDLFKVSTDNQKFRILFYLIKIYNLIFFER